jgi:hypothetical protein
MNSNNKFYSPSVSSLLPASQLSTASIIKLLTLIQLNVAQTSKCSNNSSSTSAKKTLIPLTSPTSHHLPSNSTHPQLSTLNSSTSNDSPTIKITQMPHATPFQTHSPNPIPQTPSPTNLTIQPPTSSTSLDQ